MEIFQEKENKTSTIKFTGKAKELLKRLKLNEEEFLVLKNEELVSLEEPLNDSDKIKIISIISGG